jgi:GR25 family glycosyltransferase involved in LPS biosynthesis
VLEKFCWQVLNIPGTLESRDALTKQKHENLCTIYPSLNSPTVNFTELDNPGIKKYIKYTFEDNLKPGEITIWASNLIAWDKFINSEYESLMIFEDDSILSDNFIELLDNFMLNVPNDWDVLNICTHPRFLNFFTKDLVINNYVVKNYSTVGFCGYIINKKACLKLYEIFEKKDTIANALDVFIFDQDELNIYSQHPDQSLLVSHVSMLFEDWDFKGKFYKNILNVALELSDNGIKQLIDMPSTIGN